MILCLSHAWVPMCGMYCIQTPILAGRYCTNMHSKPLYKSRMINHRVTSASIADEIVFAITAIIDVLFTVSILVERYCRVPRPSQFRYPFLNQAPINIVVSEASDRRRTIR